jgi:chorismate dehydratase
VTPPLRVGIVNYLNSRPLAWSFLRGTAGGGIEAIFLPPAQVADLLATGQLDVGLIPSIEVARIPGLEVLPGLCVAATREVRSVLLLSRCPESEIRRLALDENSRTSAALVRILLRELHGVEPECVAAAPDLDSMMAVADAALMIGDPALAVDRTGFLVHDLAAEWRRLTGRPFVFAVWAVRSGIDLGDRAEVFQQSLEEGQAEIELLIEEAAAELGLEPAAVREYLTQCLSFELGPAEREGLEEFYTRAGGLGLIT